MTTLSPAPPEEESTNDRERQVSPREMFKKRTEIDDEIRETRLEELRDKIKLKREYANRFLTIAQWWLIFVGWIILLNGAWQITQSVTLVSNSVLLALLGTSLVNVLAPAYLITKHLFSEEEPRRRATSPYD